MELKKEIGFKTLLILTINAILGTDVFFLVAIGASLSGPASLLAWIAMSVIALFISAYFAELVSMFPKAGGVYEFVKRSFGEFPSFIIGWTAWIVSNISIAMLIAAAIMYVLPSAPAYVYVIFSIFLIILFNYISYIGINQSTRMLLVFGIATILALLILIFPGIFKIDIANLSPFFVFPAASIFITIFFIAETFFGWESMTFLAEEVKDAKKVMPKVMILSTLAVAILAISLVFITLGAINWKILANSEAPLALLTEMLLGKLGSKLFALLVFIPILGSAAGFIISSPRLLFAMARDNLFILSIKKIHPKYRTPHIAILFQTIISCIIAVIALGTYQILLSLLLPLALIVYSFVLLSVIKLRKSKYERPFKAPFGTAGPIAIIFIFILLLLLWLITTQNSFQFLLTDIAFVVLGIPAYVLVKLQTDRKFVEKFMNRTFFFLSLYISNFICIEKETKKVIRNLELRNGMKVLNYGCEDGHILLGISERNINGKIVTVDISEKYLRKTLKLAAKACPLPNIIYVKLSKIAPFESETFHRICSALAVNYFVNPLKEFEKLNKILKKGGVISLLAVRAPLIIFKPFLDRDDSIRQMLVSAGFRNIKIERTKKFLREYIYIQARK